MRHISSLPKQKELARLYMPMTRTFIAHPSPLSSSSIRSFGINIISTSWWFIRYQTLSFVTINWTMSPFLKRRRGVSFFIEIEIKFWCRFRYFCVPNQMLYLPRVQLLQQLHYRRALSLYMPMTRPKMVRL